MDALEQLLENNKLWATSALKEDPDYFDRLAHLQQPDYLWIGCSDSRVPANQITGLAPGEMFVHRNIANVVQATDYNCLSVLQYAVDVLKVKHVIVCGHYGCGGIEAAMGNNDNGLVDTWLRQVKETYVDHQNELKTIDTHEERHARMCELNVMAQVENLCKTKTVQRAWGKGQSLTIHGWIYSIFDGVIKDLDVNVDGLDSIDPIYRLNPSK